MQITLQLYLNKPLRLRCGRPRSRHPMYVHNKRLRSRLQLAVHTSLLLLQLLAYRYVCPPDRLLYMHPAVDRVSGPTKSCSARRLSRYVHRSFCMVQPHLHAFYTALFSPITSVDTVPALLVYSIATTSHTLNVLMAAHSYPSLLNIAWHILDASTWSIVLHLLTTFVLTHILSPPPYILSLCLCILTYTRLAFTRPISPLRLFYLRTRVYLPIWRPLLSSTFVLSHVRTLHKFGHRHLPHLLLLCLLLRSGDIHPNPGPPGPATPVAQSAQSAGPPACHTEDHLNILNWNCRGIDNKLTALPQFLDAHDIHIAILTETRRSLGTHRSSNELRTGNYTFHFSSHIDNSHTVSYVPHRAREWGVCIAVRTGPCVPAGLRPPTAVPGASATWHFEHSHPLRSACHH